ncbi:MAG: hypothetical protein BGO31_09805 [Bacteroidetes bacterium 43-16]|nr:MAG: hypothetical protein BGO31_09805 [Bacteroidetes bacterium 43-16]
MKKIKIIALCFLTYLGISALALHHADSALYATNYTNRYYRFYMLSLGGSYVPTSNVYAITAPNGMSCLDGYFDRLLLKPVGQWFYEYTRSEPYAYACLD